MELREDHYRWFIMIGIKNHAQIKLPKTIHANATIPQRTMPISFSILWEFLYARYPANEPIRSDRAERIAKKVKTILSGIIKKLAGCSIPKASLKFFSCYFDRLIFTLPNPDSMEISILPSASS